MTAQPSDHCGELKYWCSKGAEELGIILNSEQKELFNNYFKLIVEGNKKINLTRILTEKEAALKHFVDSLACLLVVPLEGSPQVADVGSGAGLPGIPLKIAKTGIFLTMIESSKKKADFLKDTVLSLGLSNALTICGRAEEISRREEYREQFDCAFCRAVGPLPVIAEYCLGLVRVGGLMVALKGRDAEVEAQECDQLLSLLGGTLKEIRQLVLPYIGHERTLIVIEKTHPAPLKYPRRAGMPKKRPIKIETEKSENEHD
ncbi:MAG TPA: 16S rRNA (guanine(527)-N(7))-methyltransferase RsmG [Desulfotomaculum sp.]|nr:MAG: Ribosomal RNA small subunit methyltransferase G [Desulfotomaculum sp. 46_296]HAG10059.1 16S rRNA (guanine(527)-N(7))-methyltransferase RsmG [Desulfotomaculum sp.]HBY04493.1 16S rRNA (guanine(527)-N(7))-methyltransferase RsmG [Desulfotomaculum sp.]